MIIGTRPKMMLTSAVPLPTCPFASTQTGILVKLTPLIVSPLVINALATELDVIRLLLWHVPKLVFPLHRFSIKPPPILLLPQIPKDPKVPTPLSETLLVEQEIGVPTAKSAMTRKTRPRITLCKVLDALQHLVCLLMLSVLSKATRTPSTQ